MERFNNRYKRDMKQTAVGNLLKYFIKEQKEGCSHWCIHDLIAQLYVAKEMEKEQIIESWDNGFANGYDLGKHNITYPDNAEQYYNETFKSE
jgi:hypothetical protein